MRKGLLIFVVAMGLVAATGTAHAAAPVQEVFTEPATIELPGGEFCAFDVQIDIEQNFRTITFSGDRGTWIGAIGTGKILATVTNLETGESIRLSIPGPGFFETDASGNPAEGTGPWLLFIPGDPGALLYVVGHIEFQAEEFGISPTSVRGRMLDLCPALA
jgi:hypothetical protein